MDLEFGIAAPTAPPVVAHDGAWLEAGTVVLSGDDPSLKRLSLPIIRPFEGPAGLEVDSLLKNTGMVTFDPGFMNTAAVESAITFVDGEKGILRYRGYPIEQLAAHSSFLEVAYLLIYGELPTAEVLERFTRKLIGIR